MNPEPGLPCKNCGAETTGKFCAACGQKVYNENDKTVKAILHEVLHFMTHFDGTLITSIRTIYRKPGQYALDYCNGIRKRYFKPVSLFLVLVVLYLLFPVLRGLNVDMPGFMAEDGKTTFFEKMIYHKMEIRHLNLEQLSVKYAVKSEKLSKILLFILIPLSAGLLYLLNLKKKYFTFDYFILATELNIFFLFTFYLLFPFCLYMIEFFLPNTISWKSESVVVTFVLLVFGLYCFLAFKRFFSQGNFLTLLKSIIFPVVHLLVIVTLYRFILFGAVMLLL